MSNAFVYVTYIRTTPEKLWEALTEPEFHQRYFLGASDAERLEARFERGRWSTPTAASPTAARSSRSIRPTAPGHQMAQ